MDPDGFTVKIDGQTVQGAPSQVPVPTNGNVTIPTNLGEHRVVLTGFAPNCVVAPANYATLDIQSDTSITLDTVCGANLIHTGEILFDNYAEGYMRIQANGSTLEQLADNGELLKSPPAWSPDGSRVAFGAASHRSPVRSGYYVIGADGGNAVLFVATDGNARHDGPPSWAPDGNQLVFTAPERSNYVIKTVDVDSRIQTRLTDGPHHFHPRWSPDGSRIAFWGIEDNDYETAFVAIMNADGTAVQHIASSVGATRSPEWSPDGSRLAFISYNFADARDGLWVVNVDGTGLTRVAQSGNGHAWSPDGSRLVITRENRRFAIVDADGTGLQEFTMDGLAFGPSWSPDGTRLAYFHRQEDPASATDIFVVDVADTWKAQLTMSPDGAFFPSWRPTFGSPVSR